MSSPQGGPKKRTNMDGGFGVRFPVMLVHGDQGNPGLRAMRLATGDARIVEHTERDDVLLVSGGGNQLPCALRPLCSALEHEGALGGVPRPERRPADGGWKPASATRAAQRQPAFSIGLRGGSRGQTHPTRQAITAAIVWHELTGRSRQRRARPVPTTNSVMAKQRTQFNDGMPDDDDFVGLDELADRLGLSKRTVTRMVARGELPKPCLSVGGRPRWLWRFVIEHCYKRHQRDSELDRRMKRKMK
jgi:excisionase family DNA binding protein